MMSNAQSEETKRGKEGLEKSCDEQRMRGLRKAKRRRGTPPRCSLIPYRVRRTPMAVCRRSRADHRGARTAMHQQRGRSYADTTKGGHCHQLPPPPSPAPPHAYIAAAAQDRAAQQLCLAARPNTTQAHCAPSLPLRCPPSAPPECRRPVALMPRRGWGPSRALGRSHSSCLIPGAHSWGRMALHASLGVNRRFVCSYTRNMVTFQLPRRAKLGMNPL